MDDDSEPRCRICFEGSEQPHSGELISPCNCRGTQKFVHRSCLAKWQYTAMGELRNSRRAYECSVCKCLFSVKPSEKIWTRISRWLVPGWIHQAVVTSAGIFIIFLSRQFPPALQCLIAFVAIYFSSPFISRGGMASGDPVPAVMAGRYLIADGIPRGSIFYQSVILLLQHDSNVGSLGIIINNAQNVGGPVASWQSIYLTNRQTPDVNMVSGQDGLYWGRGQPRIGVDDADARVRIIHGVSGWGPRQLDGEVRRGSWKIVTADAESALSPDPTLWRTLYYSRPAAD